MKLHLSVFFALVSLVLFSVADYSAPAAAQASQKEQNTQSSDDAVSTGFLAHLASFFSFSSGTTVPLTSETQQPTAASSSDNAYTSAALVPAVAQTTQEGTALGGLVHGSISGIFGEGSGRGFHSSRFSVGGINVGGGLGAGSGGGGGGAAAASSGSGDRGGCTGGTSCVVVVHISPSESGSDASSSSVNGGRYKQDASSSYSNQGSGRVSSFRTGGILRNLISGKASSASTTTNTNTQLDTSGSTVPSSSSPHAYARNKPDTLLPGQQRHDYQNFEAQSGEISDVSNSGESATHSATAMSTLLTFGIAVLLLQS